MGITVCTGLHHDNRVKTGTHHWLMIGKKRLLHQREFLRAQGVKDLNELRELGQKWGEHELVNHCYLLLDPNLDPPFLSWACITVPAYRTEARFLGWTSTFSLIQLQLPLHSWSRSSEEAEHRALLTRIK